MLNSKQRKKSSRRGFLPHSMCAKLPLARKRLGDLLWSYISIRLRGGRGWSVPIDFRRASLCCRMAFRSRSRRSCSSRSLTAAISSRIVSALNPSNGLERSSELDGAEGWAGVSRSIKRPSLPPLPASKSSLLCCDPLAGVRRRVSSNEGILRTGDTGTVGLRMDLSGKAAVDCAATTSSQFVCRCKHDKHHCGVGSSTLRRLPLESWSASKPPGPKLLLRDFLSLPGSFAEPATGCEELISAMVFSLSSPVVSFERGT